MTPNPPFFGVFVGLCLPNTPKNALIEGAQR
jgi:hypothetical protein